MPPGMPGDMPGACRPSVTVLVEIRAGVIWDACQHAELHAVENSHVNSWLHAGLHAARHFLFLESY